MRTLARHCLIAIAALMLVLTSFDTVSVFAQAAPTQGQLIISEFRFRGPSGASDEFIEIYNTTNSSIDASGVTLFSLTNAGTNANLATTLPASTIIPAGRFYLIANTTTTTGYSLAAYATQDRTANGGIGDNTGLALCSTATLADCINVSTGVTTANRLDAVGFANASTTQTARPGFIEGTGITAISGTTPPDQFSFVRRMEKGKPIDTNNNRSDFALVSTSAAALGRTGTVGTPDGAAILGAPGPQNLTSPIRNTSIVGGLVPGVPDRTFNSAATIPTVAPAGTLVFNRRYTNNTGGTVTRLRFRIIDITTVNSPDVRAENGSTNPQQAILRVINGANATVTVNGVPLQALTLEQPPTQTNGGGLNSSVVYGTFTTPTQIAPGGTADVQFQVGVQQTGYYRFITSLEAIATPPQTLTRSGVVGRRAF